MKPEHLKIQAGERPHYQGGQHVGVSIPSVQVTHLPTGLMAFSESERSQQKNLRVAMAMIEYGLAEIGWKEADDAASAELDKPREHLP